MKAAASVIGKKALDATVDKVTGAGGCTMFYDTPSDPPSAPPPAPAPPPPAAYKLAPKRPAVACAENRTYFSVKSCSVPQRALVLPKADYDRLSRDASAQKWWSTEAMLADSNRSANADANDPERTFVATLSTHMTARGVTEFAAIPVNHDCSANGSGALRPGVAYVVLTTPLVGPEFATSEQPKSGAQLANTVHVTPLVVDPLKCKGDREPDVTLSGGGVQQRAQSRSPQKDYVFCDSEALKESPTSNAPDGYHWRREEKPAWICPSGTLVTATLQPNN